MPAHYIGEHVVISGTVEGGRRLNWVIRVDSGAPVDVRLAGIFGQAPRHSPDSRWFVLFAKLIISSRD